jgi:hypothetical protein
VRYEVWKLWSERPFWNINSNRKSLEETQTIEICAAADETAFEQDVLVLMDLSSG